MRLSPLDIKKQEFNRTLRRGYDPDEVHAFLDMLATHWEEMLAEQRRVEDKVHELKAKMAHYEKVEEALQEALQTARENSRQALDHARREAELIVKEAEVKAEEIGRDAVKQREMYLKDVEQLTGRRDEIVARLRAFLMSEAELLAHFENRIGEGNASRGSEEKKNTEAVAEEVTEEAEVAATREEAVLDLDDVTDDPMEATKDVEEEPVAALQMVVEEEPVAEPEEVESDIFDDVADAVKNTIIEQEVMEAVAYQEQEAFVASSIEGLEPVSAELEALIDEADQEPDVAPLNSEELEEVLRKMAEQEATAEGGEDEALPADPSPEIEVEVIEQVPAPEIEVEVIDQVTMMDTAEAAEVDQATSFFREDVPDHFAEEGEDLAFKFFEPSEQEQNTAKFLQDAEEPTRFASTDESNPKKGRRSRSDDRSPSDSTRTGRALAAGSSVPEPVSEEGNISPSEEVEKIRRILSDLE